MSRAPASGGSRPDVLLCMSVSGALIIRVGAGASERRVTLPARELYEEAWENAFRGKPGCGT
eukprot:3625587-Rhodomonas_salina.1